tara:strand:+ start:311 stop:568 length:258 start_codon:yes stop_codon:yes gene_type:complete
MEERTHRKGRAIKLQRRVSPYKITTYSPRAAKLSPMASNLPSRISISVDADNRDARSRCVDRCPFSKLADMIKRITIIYKEILRF